jgi:hypothetical protein
MRLPHAALWLTLSMAAALPAQADEPARPGNAAVHYWCAAAFMKRATNDQEEKLLDYIEEWNGLPPKVFIERRDAVDFLQDDLLPGRAMDLLHVGAECSFCDFDTAPLTSRGWYHNNGLLRSLARRGWAAVTLLEGQGDMVRAAELHADLLQFSAHLCQCPEVPTALSGTAVISGSLPQMEVFLALKPGPQAVRALMNRFNRVPPNPLSFSRCWVYDAKFQTALLVKEEHLTDVDLDEALRAYDVEKDDLKKLRMYGFFGSDWKAVVQALRSRKFEERRAMVESWAAQLGEELSAAAKAGEGPMTVAEQRLRAQKERMERLAKPPEGKNTPGNPFLASRAGLLLNIYVRFARFNASFEMGRLICAAALFEAENGQYPTSLDALAKYFPAGLPKDPFTGEDFLYSLEEGLPCVTAQPSASLREELRSWDCRMSLSQALKAQAARLERYRKESQSPATADQPR